MSSGSRNGTLYEHTSIDYTDPLNWRKPSHVAVNLVIAGDKRVAGDFVEVN